MSIISNLLKHNTNRKYVTSDSACSVSHQRAAPDVHLRTAPASVKKKLKN